MSEQYPTQQEEQEALDEIFAQDPDLYNYIMYAEYESPAEYDLDALEERIYLATVSDVTPEDLGEISDINPHALESNEQIWKRSFIK